MSVAARVESRAEEIYGHESVRTTRTSIVSLETRRWCGIVGGTVFRSQPAAAQSTSAASWRPARHAQDDWFDQIPGSHRFIIDTMSPSGLGSALLFANNFFVANQQGYGLGNADAAVVIVLRHNSTGFAFSDAMWAKYSTAIGEAAGNFDDPKTKTKPTLNVYNSGSYLGALPNGGVTFDALDRTRRAFRGLPDGDAPVCGRDCRRSQARCRGRLQGADVEPDSQFAHGGGGHRGGESRPGKRLRLRKRRVATTHVFEATCAAPDHQSPD